MQYFFSIRVIERWNQLDQNVVDASSVNRFKLHLQRIRETRMCFLHGSPRNPACGYTAVELATQGTGVSDGARFTKNR